MWQQNGHENHHELHEQRGVDPDELLGIRGPASRSASSGRFLYQRQLGQQQQLERHASVQTMSLGLGGYRSLSTGGNTPPRSHSLGSVYNHAGSANEELQNATFDHDSMQRPSIGSSSRFLDGTVRGFLQAVNEHQLSAHAASSTVPEHSSTGLVGPAGIAGPGAGLMAKMPSFLAENSSDSLSSMASSSQLQQSAASRMIGANANFSPPSGPSELYRLIAKQPQRAAIQLSYWSTIERRARAHPNEACFYDSSAGGHVYALHRLLRTGMTSGCTFRPPLSVVRAVMEACPRAITRKQPLISDDNLLFSDSDADVQGQQIRMQNVQLEDVVMQPNNLAQNDDLNAADADDGSDQQSDADEDAHDDVQYEYPLAIACECMQDCEIVRLLASSTHAQHAYRSEVFRSLNYASLPNAIVRILLQEFPGCVLERGTNSEASEGDDDDCALEQILFWWEDPDMMGLEEELNQYPECDRRDELQDLFEKLRMMLFAAIRLTMDGYDDFKETFQVLHHVLRVVVQGGVGTIMFPNDFLHAALHVSRFIQHENPRMFEERCQKGQLPLHIAVTGTKLLRPSELLSSPAAEEGDETMGEPAADAHVGIQAGEAIMQPQLGDVDADDAGAPEQIPPQAEGSDAESSVDEEEEEEEVGDSDDGSGSDASKVSGDIELIRLLLYENPTAIRLRDSHSGSLPLHLAIQQNPLSIEVIELFLELYPISVTMPDGQGRLPLHLALVHNSPIWQHVLRLSPDSIEARDPLTGLLPFQLASVVRPTIIATDGDDVHDDRPTSDDLDSLTITFRLLRMDPRLVESALFRRSALISLTADEELNNFKPHRVIKLEQENALLRKRVEELELRLAMLLSCDSAAESEHSAKKRKSQKMNVG